MCALSDVSQHCLPKPGQPGLNKTKKERPSCYGDGPRGRLQMLDNSKAMGKVDFGEVMLVTDVDLTDVADSRETEVGRF
jgi:hypothetical protein